jgi:DNA repair protein RecN (Recombination protein N)
VLETLAIKDFLLIDRLTVAPCRGLNVLTGETGAGKSIFLDALALALGARAAAGVVRQGADQATVTAHFTGPFPPALCDRLTAQGIEAEDSLILRRCVGKDGKSRAFVNDMPASVTLLRELGDALVEVHGQFETHGLLDAATHRGFLDSFGGFAREGAACRMAFAAWRAAETARAEAAEQSARAEAEEDFLRAATRELADLAPCEGEMDRLAERRKELQNRDKILEALTTADNALGGERGGAAAALAQAGKALARLAPQVEDLAPLLALIDQAAAQVDEAQNALAHKRATFDEGPATLETIEERLFALRAVARKHGVDAARLPFLRDDLQAKLTLLVNRDETLQRLGQEAEAARRAFFVIAEKLHVARVAAAQKLAANVMRELGPLKLDKATFAVDVARLPDEQANEAGVDRVTFQIATNPGLPPGPLHKVASGGELARLMLALKVVLNAKDGVPTLVFDEVDTGISGAVASAVGARLARLGEAVQVLVVTHSPQVAARGQRHFRVEKESKANRTATRVLELTESDRIEEIARLLAGTSTTNAAREAAKSLLNELFEHESRSKSDKKGLQKAKKRA